jgi:hypothetical protein
MVVSPADPGVAGALRHSRARGQGIAPQEGLRRGVDPLRRAHLHYERAWRDLETGFGGAPDELTHRQIVALAGEFYCEMVVRHSNDPGRPIVWE